jgi:hypothetical protein
MVKPLKLEEILLKIRIEKGYDHIMKDIALLSHTDMIGIIGIHHLLKTSWSKRKQTKGERLLLLVSNTAFEWT